MSKDFFAQLKITLLEKVNKIFDEKDIDKKIDAYSDVIKALTPIVNGFSRVIGHDKFFEKLSKRLNEREENPRRALKSSDLNRVIRFGKENDYPEMVLKKDDKGNITKKISKGKEYWDNAIVWCRLNTPYRENFMDLVEAIGKYEKTD